jgi:hypothetical protein
MLPQMVEDAWTALVAQVKTDFRNYAKADGGGAGCQCIDQNPNNLLVVHPPAHSLEIWRDTDHSIVKYDWADDSGVRRQAVKLEPPENIEQLSQKICKPFIDYLSHRG